MDGPQLLPDPLPQDPAVSLLNRSQRNLYLRSAQVINSISNACYLGT